MQNFVTTNNPKFVRPDIPCLLTDILNEIDNTVSKHFLADVRKGGGGIHLLVVVGELNKILDRTNRIWTEQQRRGQEGRGRGGKIILGLSTKRVFLSPTLGP